MLRFSDLVRDSRLETRIRKGVTCHRIPEIDLGDDGRPVSRKEYWEKSKDIGSGGFGRVWLEQCIKGQKDTSLRAIKQILKPQDETGTTHTIDYNRELEAIAKFSHPRVSSQM